MKHRELSTALQNCPTSLDIRGRQMKATLRLHLPPARMAKISKWMAVNTGQKEGKGNIHSLLVGLQTGKATVGPELTSVHLSKGSEQVSKGMNAEWHSNHLLTSCWGKRTSRLLLETAQDSLDRKPRYRLRNGARGTSCSQPGFSTCKCRCGQYELNNLEMPPG